MVFYYKQLYKLLKYSVQIACDDYLSNKLILENSNNHIKHGILAAHLQ